MCPAVLELRGSRCGALSGPRPSGAWTVVKGDRDTYARLVNWLPQCPAETGPGAGQTEVTWGQRPGPGETVQKGEGQQRELPHRDPERRGLVASEV